MKGKIRKGFKPNMYLSNVSVAYVQSVSRFIASTIFPVVPVALQSSYYTIFDKADLMRDNVRRKPKFGRVNPGTFGSSNDLYFAEVDQIILGIDQFDAVNYAAMPGMADPKKAKTILATQQMLIHQDRMWADAYFKSGVWTEEWAGVDSAPSGKQFLKFSNTNSDPIKLLKQIKRNQEEQTGFVMNRLVLGAKAFDELTENADIIDRIKYGGGKGIVTEDIIAQMIGVERVVVPGSIYNAAGLGEAADFKFIVGAKDALFCYANPAPAIDQPSAGYIFNWSSIVPGANLPFVIDAFEGEAGTHSEFVEGLCAYDMKQVSKDLAVYLKDCV